MNGYAGTIVSVDLTTGSVRKEPLSAELRTKFIGGRGMNSRIIYKELKKGIDPLGPENKLIISAGPCNGTLVPGSCRYTITSKSPLTGLHGDSNSGGFFGTELKYAGYDAVIIEGISPKPVYLFIDDDKVQIKSAEHLWGMSTIDASSAVKQELGDPDIQVISIGPGGENLVKFANVMTDLGRACGRTGQGAVFGSKKLKSVAVRGSRGVKVAHPRLLEEASKEVHESWTAAAGKGSSFTHTLDLRFKYGPAAGWSRYDKFGMFPTRNYQGGGFKDMLPGLDSYFATRKACISCPAGCDHLFVIDHGPYAGVHGGGLELTILDMAPRIGNEDQDLTVRLHALCDRCGIDYMDTSASVAFALECYQRGVITKADTGGLELEWNKAEPILTLIDQICHRQGFGAVLADGLKISAERIGHGSEKYAIQVKGQTLVPRDPRASKGWALAYAVSSRGPCHVRAYLPETYPAEAWDESIQPVLAKYKDPTNPLLEEGKGELVKWNEDITAFKNSMEICLFMLYSWMVKSVSNMMTRLFYAVTGTQLTEEEMLMAGERIVNVERAFNIREGLTRADDTLPVRMLTEPYPEGPAKGQVVHLDQMLDDYYHYRGWTKEGVPTEEKLKQLGLEDVWQGLQA